MKYEPLAGTSIDQAVKEAFGMAINLKRTIRFDFNGTKCTVSPLKSQDENTVACRAKLGLPAVDPPFHAVTALDALARWDKGESVFTIEMGGLGPGYEQAIQILVFELIRDFADKPVPTGKDFDGWGDPTVHRIDEKCGGFSGAQVGAAKQVAYRAIRDGWGKMLESVPADRKIQVSKHFPHL